EQGQAQVPASAPAATASQPVQQPAEQPASPQENQPPIVINAAFSRVDYNTNRVIFSNITVSQGDTRLTAARAHAAGVGFANTEWTFEEGVTIVSPQPRPPASRRTSSSCAQTSGRPRTAGPIGSSTTLGTKPCDSWATHASPT